MSPGRSSRCPRPIARSCTTRAAIDGVTQPLRRRGPEPAGRDDADRVERSTGDAEPSTSRWSRALASRRSASAGSATARSSEVVEHAERSSMPRRRSVAGDGLIDLGCGGGVPGLVIAGADRTSHVVLVDRRATRADHLRRLVGRLGLADRVVVRPSTRRSARHPAIGRCRRRPRLRRPDGTWPAGRPAAAAGGRFWSANRRIRRPVRWPPAVLDRCGLQPSRSGDRAACSSPSRPWFHVKPRCARRGRFHVKPTMLDPSA